MGIFDFFRRKSVVTPNPQGKSDSELKQIISATNKMIKMQLMLAASPTTTPTGLFRDTFFLGYFYGIHDAAFQWSGHRKSSIEMHVTYMLAISNFLDADTPAASKNIADTLIEIMTRLTANEGSPTFQKAQLIAGTEYYALMEGKSKSLVGLLNHLMPARAIHNFINHLP